MPPQIPARRKPPKSPQSAKHNSHKTRRAASGKRSTPAALWRRDNLFWLSIECLGLAIAALLGTMLALESSANAFSGTQFFANLLPFAAGMAVWALVCAGLMLIWLRCRGGLKRILTILPGLLAIGMATGMAWFVWHDGYNPVLTDLRSLIGGKQQAARVTLAHQVYAAYRRHDPAQLQKMLQRAEPFNIDIQQAAEVFSIDVNLLQGIAATESSFMPRTSHDGGQGLFQITAVPKFILQQARDALAIKQLALANPRHNAFIAAATLKHYLAEMKNDLFLGLLAYNIGPRNGGLRFIMQQYGATDFVTMQPYLQQLPRDYPIRVLAYALSFKLWQQEGRLLAYEEGENALRIQQLGIPGLANEF
ncbi:MAG: transglycosylase [Methylomonas sp.]|nr:MAG: transglycosylase [Methylomonas sp.]